MLTVEKFQYYNIVQNHEFIRGVYTLSFFFFFFSFIVLYGFTPYGINDLFIRVFVLLESAKHTNGCVYYFNIY